MPTALHAPIVITIHVGRIGSAQSAAAAGLVWVFICSDTIECARSAARTRITLMESPFFVDYLSEWPLNLMSGLIAGVGVVILVTAVRLMLDVDAVQFSLMALIALGVSIFAYKTEVKKQESVAGDLEGSRIEHARSEYEAALRKGLELALRTHE